MWRIMLRNAVTSARPSLRLVPNPLTGPSEKEGERPVCPQFSCPQFSLNVFTERKHVEKPSSVNKRYMHRTHKAWPSDFSRALALEQLSVLLLRRTGTSPGLED
jgi:hypothetical protein